MNKRTLTALALGALAPNHLVQAAPPAASAAQPVASAASNPLRAHPYPFDGVVMSNLVSGYEALVHSWEANNRTAPPDMRQASYRICNLGQKDSLYFQWSRAGFNTGPKGMPASSCAELDRFAVGTVKTQADATIEFTRRSVKVPHPTTYIEPPGLLGRVQTLVRLTAPASLRGDWSPGQRSFQLSTERKAGDSVAKNDVRWNASTVVYIPLPTTDAHGALVVRASPGAEAVVLRDGQALSDFTRSVELEAAFGERWVLRLTPAKQGESSATYDLPLAGRTRDEVLVVLRNRTDREDYWTLRYDTPRP